MGRGKNPAFPDNETIRQLWVRGWHPTQIARHYGMSPRTVDRRLRESDEDDEREEQRRIQTASRPEYV